MHFIATRREAWDEDAFFASGAEQVHEALAWLGPGHRRVRALDIGCGLGRLAVHLADAFEQVDAIDISPEMIERARAMHDRPNLRFHAASGVDLGGLETNAFDLVYSYIVFQHVDQEAIIRSIVAEIARVLRPDGRAILQFDTRAPRLLRRCYHTLPDWLLPRVHRRHVRRYPRRPETLEQLFRAAGLEVEAERGRGGPQHFYKLHPAAGAPRA
jgi:ubiquinone/menaquinone biosynthesis C-methylase UbiE